MDITRYAGLARPVDLKYKSNFAIVITALILLLPGTIYQFFLGNDIPDSIGWGVKLSLVAFLTWMTARELDPDRNISAFLAIPFSLVAFFYFPEIQILLLIGLILALRIVNQITGQHARWVESFIVLGLGTYLTWRDSHLFGFAISAAFLADSRLSLPHQRHFWFGCVALLISLIVIILSLEPGAARSLSTEWLAFVIINCLLFIFVIRRYKHPQSSRDYSHKPLNARRIQAAQVLALTAMLVHFVDQGSTGLFQTSIFWSAVLATNLVQLYQMAVKH